MGLKHAQWNKKTKKGDGKEKKQTRRLEGAQSKVEWGKAWHISRMDRQLKRGRWVHGKIHSPPQIIGGGKSDRKESASVKGEKKDHEGPKKIGGQIAKRGNEEGKIPAARCLGAPVANAGSGGVCIKESTFTNRSDAQGDQFVRRLKRQNLE